MDKFCHKCNTKKELNEFHNDKYSKDGKSSKCKSCACKNTKEYNKNNKVDISQKRKIYYKENKEIILINKKEYYKENIDNKKEYNKKYYTENKNEIISNVKTYYANNIDDILEYQKKYREENKEKLKLKRDKYRDENKEEINKRDRKRRNKFNKENPYVVAWRTILRRTIKLLEQEKNDKTIKLLGYSSLELKKHIENLFTTGMNWDNYGEWHIDHIKPISTFDKDTKPSVVNNLSNLRPLWATTREIDGVVYEGNLNRKKYHRNEK